MFFLSINLFKLFQFLFQFLFWKQKVFCLIANNFFCPNNNCQLPLYFCTIDIIISCYTINLIDKQIIMYAASNN